MASSHASWAALAESFQQVMGTSAIRLRGFARALDSVVVDLAAQDGRNAEDLGSPVSELDDATELPLPEGQWTRPHLPDPEEEEVPPYFPGPGYGVHQPGILTAESL